VKARLPWLLAAVLPLLVCAALWWPVPLHLDSFRVHTAFGDSHAWVLDRVFGGGVDCAAGYPRSLSMRPIAWVPLLMAAVLRPLLGTLGAMNAVQLLSLPATSVVTAIWLHRSTEVDRCTAALLGATWALSPTFLGTLATGEISNTQGWILPGFLLAAGVRGPGRLLAMGLVALSAAMTSPYYALALPLMAGVHELWRAVSIRTWGQSAAGLAATALGLLPAWFFYGSHDADGRHSLFRPARQLDVPPTELPVPAPVAQLEDLLWQAPAAPGSDTETVHVVTLGLALLVGGIWAAWRGRGRTGHRAGLALLVGGVLASLGPVLYLGGLLRGLGPVPLPLPVAALELVGWPTRQGGLYFRYAVVAGLGLVALVGVGLNGRRHAVLVASGLLGLQLCQSIWTSGPWTERERGPIAGRTVLERLSGDDGAVLELPLQGVGSAWLGQPALLRAVVHKRPTTALPRDDPRGGVRVRQQLSEAMRAADSRAALRDHGYRLMVLPHDQVQHVEPDRRRLEAAFGPPDHRVGLYIWDLGPTETLCEPPGG